MLESCKVQGGRNGENICLADVHCRGGRGTDCQPGTGSGWKILIGWAMQAVPKPIVDVEVYDF